MSVIARKEAKENGKTRYFTGNPCKYGHVAERFVSSRQCVECLRPAVARRMRKYREDPEYGKARREYDRQYKRKRYAEDPDFRARDRERGRRRYEDPAHREHMRKSRREYVKNNLAKFAAWASKRRAAQLQRTPDWADEELIAMFYAEARDMTETTGILYEVDHIIPMQGESVSGLHVAPNLQILTRSENRAKGNKHDRI